MAAAAGAMKNQNNRSARGGLARIRSRMHCGLTVLAVVAAERSVLSTRGTWPSATFDFKDADTHMFFYTDTCNMYIL